MYIIKETPDKKETWLEEWDKKKGMPIMRCGHAGIAHMKQNIKGVNYDVHVCPICIGLTEDCLFVNSYEVE